jgi:hypothetical protein
MPIERNKVVVSESLQGRPVAQLHECTARRQSVRRGESQSAGPTPFHSSALQVCDNGTGFVKIGFAADAFPRSFPCMVGRPLTEATRGPLASGELKVWAVKPLWAECS